MADTMIEVAGVKKAFGTTKALCGVDLAADRFEQALRQGHRPQITEYLDEVPDTLRLRLLVELVCLDFEYTIRDHTVTLGDYFRARGGYKVIRLGTG